MAKRMFLTADDYAKVRQNGKGFTILAMRPQYNPARWNKDLTLAYGFHDEFHARVKGMGEHYLALEVFGNE